MEENHRDLYMNFLFFELPVKPKIKTNWKLKKLFHFHTRNVFSSKLYYHPNLLLIILQKNSSF